MEGTTQVVCSCGSIFMPDAVFCRNCGEHRDKAEGRMDKKLVDMSGYEKQCECGSVFKADAKHCRSCGLKRKLIPES